MSVMMVSDVLLSLQIKMDLVIDLPVAGWRRTSGMQTH